MKNYTSLEKMKASEVCPTYTEEKVTAETFPAEVAKGTLYRGFQPPKDATMLKFRYYSPDGTLMEQNNVPVVYDGTGISAITTFYLLTDESDGITLESDGWTETVQTVTAEKRFLWTYIKTTYTNKTYSCTEPCISAVFGEQGERGAMYLGHYADNQAAYEANKPAVFTGDYYLNTTDSYIHVYSKESNGWDVIEELTDYRYNQSINDIFAAIENSTTKEEFIKAKKIWVQNMSAAIARVQMLLANEIKLTSGTDLDGKTTGGIIRSANYDGTLTDGKITASGTKGWAIDYDGKAEFNNVTVRGTVDGSTIKGPTISGTTISGGSIIIGDKFSVDESGNLIANGGIFKNNCIFAGSIASGPLYLDEDNPTSISSQKIFSVSDSSTLLENYLQEQGIKPYTLVNGTVNGLPFSYISGTLYGNGYILVYKFSDKKFNSVYTYNAGEVKKGTNVFTSPNPIPVEIVFNLYNPIGKTLKLIDLPTSKASTSGFVYQDSEGYLRIS